MKLIYLPTHLPLKTHQPSMDIVKYTANSSHGFLYPWDTPPTFDFDADARGVLSVDFPPPATYPKYAASLMIRAYIPYISPAISQPYPD